MKRLTFFLISIFLVLGIGIAHAQKGTDKKPQIVTKNDVSPEEADKETSSIILSLGFSTPAIGSDPCSRMEKSRMGGSNIQIKGASEMTGLPGKPSVNIGKSGQAMEGETDELTAPYSEGNICIESIDSEGNPCVRATSDETGKVTYENLSDKSCVVQLGEDYVLRMSPKSEVTLDPPREKTTGEKILEFIGKVWKENRELFGTTPPQRPSRTSIAGVRGNCDPYGVTSGCVIDKGSAWVIPSWMNPMDKLREAEKKGWVEKLRNQRVNPNPESSTLSGGPSPSKTYLGEATKSGYKKEKEARTHKGGQVTNPTGEGGGFSTRGFDLCGRHLPTPQEMIAMKLDPGHIVDPADKTWTGRIEQIGQERSLVWSKSIRGSDGNMVKVERRYTNGTLSSISYTFYDRNGKQIGTVNYNANHRLVTGERR